MLGNKLELLFPPALNEDVVFLKEDVVFLNTFRNLVSQPVNAGELGYPLRDL
jgi:hypothetical protein